MKSRTWYLLEKILLSFLVLAQIFCVALFLYSGNELFLVPLIFLFLLTVPICWGFIEAKIGIDRVQNLYKKIGESLQFTLGLIIVCFSICIVAYQVYSYLRIGEWISISLIDGLSFLKIKWAIKPNDWKGLWDILSIVPFSIFSYLIGMSLMFYRDEAPSISQN